MSTVKINMQLTCTGDVNIRTGPSTSYKSIGVLKTGTVVTATEQSGLWYKHSKGGWSCSKAGNMKLLVVTKNNGSGTVQKDVAVIASQPKKNDTILTTYKPFVNDYQKYNTSLINSLPIKSFQGIHGLPYQYMNATDNRLMINSNTESAFGRVYADRIVSKMPLLMMTPGRPAFMKSYSKSEKKGVFSKLVDTALGIKDTTTIENIVTTPGRYYTFNFNYADYYSFVNNMAHITAIYLGIGDKNIILGGKNKKAKYFDWSTAVSDDFKGFFSAKEFVAFYVDSENQISENFSTNTKESMLSDKVNNLSSLAKEVSFLLGAGAGVQLDWMNQDQFESNIQNINDVMDKYLNGNQLFKDIGSNFSIIASGGKIVFPEIWDDTTFTRSYDINLKLRTPDGDKYSWYMNIAIPLIHIIALAAPQQMGPNGYKSPFLVRAFYKGLFNCDMGIITSLSISKGNQSAWSIDGLPTEVDVNFTLKDLYTALSIANIEDMDKAHGFKNTCFMDYLANMCGVNINKPELLRSVDMYLAYKASKLINLPNTKWTEFEQYMTNNIANTYDRFFKY
jgi:hypothetical protein